MRSLLQLVNDEGEKYPLAVVPISEDMFVDDLLTGASSLPEALALKNDVTSLLRCAGFELKKWSSSSDEFLSSIAEEDKEPVISFTKDENHATIKVLGIKWCPKKDSFTYHVQPITSRPTKRNILSHIARIFDALGWITPVVIYAKILMQRLWLQGIGWDELPDQSIQGDWFTFTSELPLLSDVNLARYVLSDAYKELSIHGFCDASTKAYAAVIYLRVVHNDNSVSVHLFLAKSRVAPLKTISLPRLELCGAVLLSKLLDYCNKVLSNRLMSKPTTFAWSDSTITLNWIHNSPHILKTFIANRIAVIQNKTNPGDWYYVPSSSNPADCASRGLFPSQLIQHSLWWLGPDWLHRDPKEWPTQDVDQMPLTNLPELRQSSLHSNIARTEPTDLSMLERFSNLERMKRVTAWCMRFFLNCSRKPEKVTTSFLTVDELRLALEFWIKQTQKHYFPDIFHRIEEGISLLDVFSRLDVFVDSKGLLRVGGRLKFSDLSYESKHPLLLPKQAHLVVLIVDYYHQTYFHVGPRTLLAVLLRRYWIISSRNLIRKRLRLCLKCTKLKAANSQPIMAPLPASRLQRNRPFLQVGADFGGPFQTKSRLGRKPTIYKSYLCLFVCLSTKALHLEVVSSLSTEDFLAAFNRFVARRGLISDIFTDNGTNFVGSNNQLKEINQFLKTNSDDIQTALSVQDIKWHFNPPTGAHFGGLWEAGIKSAKSLLKKIIGEQILTFEELTTLFCQIEAILNSRPLCTISTDTSEFEVLTPGHFLIGDSLLAPPQPDLTNLPMNRLSRWQMIQQATQHFWHRWSTEYLHTLQQRAKWTKQVPDLSIGDIVLIKEANLPPLRWALGRVIELHPGRDGVTRVVSLQTKNHQKVLRPVVKLCPLPA